MEFDTPEYWAHEYREQQERQQQQQMEEHYNFCSQVVHDFIKGNLTREEAEGYFASRCEDPANLDEWVANTTASDDTAGEDG